MDVDYSFSEINSIAPAFIRFIDHFTEEVGKYVKINLPAADNQKPPTSVIPVQETVQPPAEEVIEPSPTIIEKTVYVDKRYIPKPLIVLLFAVIALAITMTSCFVYRNTALDKYISRYNSVKRELRELKSEQLYDVYVPSGSDTKSTVSDSYEPSYNTETTTSVYDVSEDTEDFSDTSEDPIVYITETGSKYHNYGCRYLSRSMIEKHLSDVVDSYDPCSVCDPPTE